MKGSLETLAVITSTLGYILVLPVVLNFFIEYIVFGAFCQTIASDFFIRLFHVGLLMYSISLIAIYIKNRYFKG